MSVRDICIGMLLGDGGEGKNQDLLFHDILDKGTVIFEHNIANGYSFKLFVYTFVPSDSGFHYDMYSETFYGTHGNGRNTSYGIRFDGQTGEYIGSNQYVLYASGSRAVLYAVVYKDSVPLYALMNYYVRFNSDEPGSICVYNATDPEDPGKTYSEYRYFKYWDNIKVLSINGGGGISSVMTHSQTFYISDTAYTADFVDGGYNGSFGFGGQYSYQHYEPYYDTETQQYYQKKDRVMTSTFSSGNRSSVYLIPDADKDYITRVHSDLDTDQLNTIFQGVIDALRSEANIDSYPISMLEVID